MLRVNPGCEIYLPAGGKSIGPPPNKGKGREAAFLAGWSNARRVTAADADQIVLRGHLRVITRNDWHDWPLIPAALVRA